MIMTVGQAVVRFLDNQYVSIDNKETKFVDGVFTIFGHGFVLGLGQALEENPGSLKVYQGRNEQGMAHTATAFAKQNNRLKIIACASSIGPGAANMVTAAATATVNNIPLLLFPSDTYANRQPDPVLQQFEQEDSLAITTTDAFKPVCRYWDRVNRPEQLMTALIQAMRVLTEPGITGAVCVALPQDVQGESFDFPEEFFRKRVHRIRRALPVAEEISDAAKLIKESKKPLIICGGGVRYSMAGEVLEAFAEKYNIPFAETQAGKSACKSSNRYNLGGIGVTGNLAANRIAREADCIIAVGSRMTDFTTGSKELFGSRDIKLVTINASRFHAMKCDAAGIVGDAKASIEALDKALCECGYESAYKDEIIKARSDWEAEMKKLADYRYDESFEPLIKARDERSIEEFVEVTGGSITQTSAICMIRELIDSDAIVTGASGSLPGDLQRMWTTDARDSYHMEYGYSCMGYEISSVLGAKLAYPERECYAFTGDGAYLMLHSELLTAMQEQKKVNILLFDNCGFGCINNLQMSNGIGSLATEFRYRESKDGTKPADNRAESRHNGGLIPIDFAKAASGYGLVTYSVKTLEELKNALIDSKKQTVSTLIDIKVLPKTMTDGYGAWWNVGLASHSGIESVNAAYEKLCEKRQKARKY